MAVILTHLARLYAGLAARCRQSTARRSCLIGLNAQILPGGMIVNLQKAQTAITIGDHTWIAGQLLVFAHAGRITVGDYCYIGESSRVWSAAEVMIGNRVFLAHGVNIHDNDSHSVSAMQRHKHFRELATTGVPSFAEDIGAGPVRVEDDVWIGFNSSILKGATIGKGAIIGACTVVTRDVPAYAIVAGNPAVVIGESKP
ncbi:MAG: acyltransferase [Nitrospira sp.]|jgi:acetyltransferase-like isoleucine patch superfamily enzyme|nr:acyltransferase [Nitrospira sp.]